MTKRNIYLVTNGFPNDMSEAPFILPELKELVMQYQVTIIACMSVSNSKVPDRKNIAELIGKDIPVYRYQAHKKSLLQMIESFFVCLHPIFLKEAYSILKSRKMIIKRLWSCYLFFTQSEEFYRWLKRENIINKAEEGIYYTYWNVYYCLHIGLHRKQYPFLKFISRLHGYDLYKHQTVGDWQPFKTSIDDKYDRLIFISLQGRQYFLEKFANTFDEKKYSISRLGVYNQRQKSVVSKKPFLLMSCSNIDLNKRVILIVEALAKLEMELHWVHFGDGIEKDNTERKAKELLGPKSNIIYTFMMRRPNSEILAYYQDNYPSCFINVSKSEGSPVSAQEAIAFGTPIIVTDVGGNRELVNKNGYVLSSNPNPGQVAEAIQRMASLEENEYVKMRQASYEIWQTEFNRSKNIVSFIDILNEL